MALLEMKESMMMSQNKSRRTIFFDFDGCIADTIDAMCACYNIEYANKENFTKAIPEKIQKWNARDEMTLADRDYVADIFSSSLFWDSIALNEGVKEFFDKYSERIVICTLGTHENMINKIKFIQKHLGNVMIVPIIKDMTDTVVACKKVVNMEKAIFIDDNMHNLRSSNADYKICYADRGRDKEWNSSWEGSWAFDVEDVERYVKMIDMADGF